MHREETKNIGFVVSVVMSMSALLLFVGIFGYNLADPPQKGEVAERAAYLSWMVSTQCAEGPEKCSVALRKANNNELGIVFYEDGSVSRKPKTPGQGPDTSQATYISNH